VSVYRFTIGQPRWIVCALCGARERDWSERATSKWKAAHTQQHTQGLERKERMP